MRPASARVRSSNGFQVHSTSQDVWMDYDALQDPHLRPYFTTNAPLLRHLQSTGLVSTKGHIVQDAEEKALLVDRAFAAAQKYRASNEETLQRALKLRHAMEALHRDVEQKRAKCRNQREKEAAQCSEKKKNCPKSLSYLSPARPVPPPSSMIPPQSPRGPSCLVGRVRPVPGASQSAGVGKAVIAAPPVDNELFDGLL